MRIKATFASPFVVAWTSLLRARWRRSCCHGVAVVVGQGSWFAPGRSCAELGEERCGEDSAAVGNRDCVRRVVRAELVQDVPAMLLDGLWADPVRHRCLAHTEALGEILEGLYFGWSQAGRAMVVPIEGHFPRSGSSRSCGLRGGPWRPPWASGRHRRAYAPEGLAVNRFRKPEFR